MLSVMRVAIVIAFEARSSQLVRDPEGLNCGKGFRLRLFLIKITARSVSRDADMARYQFLERKV